MIVSVQKAYHWNEDKPHRCPVCHAVADPKRRCRWAVVTCCSCGKHFTRYPRLATFLPKLGIVCDDH